ncbi:MAG: hypothetical protein ACE14L_06225 [Terriglobales bacterium]
MLGPPTRSEVSDGPAKAWWQRISPRQTTLLGIGAALCIFAVLSVASELGVRYPRWIPSMWVVDLAVALVWGVLFARTLRDAQKRHRQMLQRLRMISEMNHHIRNALEQIELSAHTSQDQRHVEILHAATARIEWALREVLPQDGEKEQ